MKKFLAVTLSCLTAISLFACADNKPTQRQEEGEEWRGEPSMCMRYDTMIQDVDGVDKCFWEDGKARYDDVNAYTPEIQIQKSAILTVQTEYDMWFEEYGLFFDFTKSWWPLEYECDETKIEIKPNPDKESHFIIKLLQPCDGEEITFKLTQDSPLYDMYDENGNPYLYPEPDIHTIIVSSVD